MFFLNETIGFRKIVPGHFPVTAQGHTASLCAYSSEVRIIFKRAELQ